MTGPLSAELAFALMLGAPFGLLAIAALVADTGLFLRLVRR